MANCSGVNPFCEPFICGVGCIEGMFALFGVPICMPAAGLPGGRRGVCVICLLGMA